jgi:hypothetical protein
VLSKNEEKRLREALRRTFLHGYPNPERRGCPGSDILNAIASGKLTLEEAEPWINHLSSCSPCTREFSELRKGHQRRRILQVSGAAAGVLLAAAIAAWFLVRSSLGPAQLRPVTVDLSGWAILRGSEGSPPNPPLRLAKGYLDMTLYLPAGSEPGTYDVQLVREPGQPIWSAQREAKLENYKATLRVQVDLRHFSPGLYLLAFRRQDRSWTYIPLVLK